MNDKELLELAAKAAGIVPQWRDQTLSTYRPGICDPIGWNPLTDDGDELRLAVKLDLEIRPDTSSVAAAGDGVWEDQAHSGDKLAATRRAIVRAAAEIGKARP